MELALEEGDVAIDEAVDGGTVAADAVAGLDVTGGGGGAGGLGFLAVAEDLGDEDGAGGIGDAINVAHPGIRGALGDVEIVAEADGLGDGGIGRAGGPGGVGLGGLGIPDIVALPVVDAVAAFADVGRKVALDGFAVSPAVGAALGGGGAGDGQSFVGQDAAVVGGVAEGGGDEGANAVEVAGLGGVCPDGSDHGHDDRAENSDDGDDGEELDQGEAKAAGFGAWVHGAGLFQDSMMAGEPGVMINWGGVDGETREYGRSA